MLKLLFSALSLARASFLQGGDGEAFDPNECGVTASCMANIPNCKPGDEKCAIVSWKMNQNDLDVTLTHSGEKTWVAIGLTPVGRPNQDGMSLADIYYCQDRPVGLGIESAWSPENTRPSLKDEYDGAVMADSVKTYRNGSAYTCSFTKKGSFQKEDNFYNMTESNTWNIIIAKGKMTADDPNKPNYHGYSAEPNEGNAILASNSVKIYSGMEHVAIGLPIGNGTDIEVEKEPISLVKVHAIMMYLAWGVLAPIGISMSALLKVTMKTGAQWFHLHRVILTMVMLLTVTAFILIFVEKKAWVTYDKSVQHAIMGCIVTTFCLINPIMGILRPDLDSPNRWLFNIFHYIVGYGAQALAYATLMIAIVDLFGLEEWTWYSLAGAIALWVVSLLVAKIVQKFKNNVSSESSQEKGPSCLGTILTVLFYVSYFSLSFAVLIELSL